MKDDVWKSFFRKLAGWYLATSLRINLIAENFQGFSVNERLRMVTFCSCIKCLKNTCQTVFYCICWLHFCKLYMKQRFLEVLYETCVLKNFSNFTNIKKQHKQQSSGGILSKDVHKKFAKFTKKKLPEFLFY